MKHGNDAGFPEGNKNRVVDGDKIQRVHAHPDSPDRKHQRQHKHADIDKNDIAHKTQWISKQGPSDPGFPPGTGSSVPAMGACGFVGADELTAIGTENSFFL
jgi:hypothetical protein